MWRRQSAPFARQAQHAEQVGGLPGSQSEAVQVEVTA
jgi:hypothetical protein